MKIWIYIFSFCLSTLSTSAKYFEFVVRVKDYETSEILPNAHGSVFLNGVQQFSTKTKEGELMFKLEYQREYIVEIEDQGHEKLTFRVNTTVPAEMTKYVYNFVSKVNMIKSKKGFKIKYTQDPTINVVYNIKTDQFTMPQQYTPSYNYVSENPTVEPPKPTKPVAKPEPKKIQKDTLKPPVLVSREDILEDRKEKSKQDIILIDREREKERDLEMRNYTDMSKKRRSFMEEIADSQRGIKIVIFEKSTKRLP